MDSSIVFTRNIVAILGLRAMYFLRAAAAAKFHRLSHGLAVILVFIGAKMLLTDVFKFRCSSRSAWWLRCSPSRWSRA
jgi:tellurite resistance protein TerC